LHPCTPRLNEALQALAGPAAAHPSDFDTLTVDLLVGSRGLEAIDAAVVVSDSAPWETVEPAVRADIARQLLALLDVPTGSADIDAEDSERYHWVGFVIRFPQPVLGATTPIEIDTSQLQALTAGLGLAFLKISVCGVSGGPEYSHPGCSRSWRLRRVRRGRPDKPQ
jgi:hypothetical protein